MKDKDLIWEEIDVKHIIQDEWIDFRKSTYRYPDGKIYSPFYSYSRRDYTVIVASDIEGNYICVKQFRQGIKEVTTEFPAGGIEKDEDPLEAAKRELLEETGYVSKDWTHLLTIPSHATISDNYAHLYMAKNCLKKDIQHLDETERLEIITLSKKEIEDLIYQGNFKQSTHALAWFLSDKKTR